MDLPLCVVFVADNLHDFGIELDVRKDMELFCVVLDVFIDLRSWEVGRCI